MAKNIDTIAKTLGARVVGQGPETGGGAFGAAKLAQVVASLQARFVPGQGNVPGDQRARVGSMCRRCR